MAIQINDVAAQPAVPQLSRRAILATWAAATAPMALGMWVVAPALQDSFGSQGLFKAIVVSLTVALIWQFVLVVALVAKEQGSLQWGRVKPALWLVKPTSPKTGQRGGRLWWMILPAIVLAAAVEFIPTASHPDDHDMGVFVESDAGQAFFSGNWTWLIMGVVLFVFNTFLGEELLFRGYLLPRMQGEFGQRAWIANGVLFAFYHLHVWWAIPGILVFSTLAFAWTSQRYRSAWIGIAAHSAQTVVLTALLVSLVLK